MSKIDKVSLIVILILIVGIGISYYFIQQQKSNLFLALRKLIFEEKEEMTEKTAADEEEEEEGEEREEKEKHPDVVQGTINFSKEENRTIIETEKGEDLVLWPPYPGSHYEERGIEEGQKVKIRGKLLSDQRIYVGEIEVVE